MPSHRRLRVASRLLVGATLATLLTPALPALRAVAAGPIDVVGRSVHTSVDHQRIVPLPIAASHVTLHWTGSPDARVSIAVGATPASMSEEIPFEAEEPGPLDGDETYGPVIWSAGARFVRVTSDRALGHLTVVAIDATDRRLRVPGTDPVANGATTMPAIISRAGWGANEAYRFDGGGHERFAPGFFPLQKAIVHHTAGRNDDPDPAATIRAIYYDHAVIRGYGDIDYNYLIDAQGRIYEGRHSRDYSPGEPITAEDLAGNVVRGSHARDFNDGTVGIVLLGTFTSVQPTTAARNALIRLLGWKLERHGIDPKGYGLYVNPQLGNSKNLYNISGHRDVNATACPGQAFYDTFPQLRQQVADYIASTTGVTRDSAAPTVQMRAMVANPTGAIRIPFGLLFSEPVTGLTADDLAVSGTSAGWTIESLTGKAADYQVTLVRPPGDPPPDEGTVVLTLAANAVTDLATHTGPAALVSATMDFVHDTTAPTVVLYQTPHRTLSNATFFDWTATFSEPVLGFAVADVKLGGPAGGTWSIQRIFGQDARYSFTTNQATLSDGVFTLQVPAGAVTDLAGNPVQASALVTMTIDRSAPTTSYPLVGVRAGTTLNGGTPRVLVSWSGNDVGPAGIASYDVARSYDGGAFQAIANGITATSLAWSMTPGHTYRFEVRARDKVGNLGGWKAGPTIRSSLIQQYSSLVHFYGGYSAVSSSAYSGGSTRYITKAGAYAYVTTTARSLAFVTTRGPGRGAFKVYVDGVYQATIDAYASSTTYRYVAFSKTWSASGTHTLKIVAVGTSGRPRVDIDAFAVIR